MFGYLNTILFSLNAIYLSYSSNSVGSIVSKIILGIIFYALVTPIGKLFLLFNKDPMNRKLYKKSQESVFISRNSTFSKKDLEQAY